MMRLGTTEWFDWDWLTTIRHAAHCRLALFCAIPLGFLALFFSFGIRVAVSQ